jgi:hypothetical protein
MNAPAGQPSQDPLLAAFRLGPDDLAANRAGRLGPRQLRRLNRSALPELALGVLLIVAALLAIRWGRWSLVAGVVGLTWIASVIRRLVSARREGTVGCLTGPVQVMLLYRQNAGFWLTVEGRSFRLPVRPDDIDNGATYRVYYRRAVHRIVAMELVPHLSPGLESDLPEAG